MSTTSIDVVLLDRSDACITMKQRRLKAKARLRTASSKQSVRQMKTTIEDCYTGMETINSTNNSPKARKIIARLPAEEE